MVRKHELELWLKQQKYVNQQVAHIYIYNTLKQKPKPWTAKARGIGIGIGVGVDADTSTSTSSIQMHYHYTAYTYTITLRLYLYLYLYLLFTITIPTLNPNPNPGFGFGFILGPYQPTGNANTATMPMPMPVGTWMSLGFSYLPPACVEMPAPTTTATSKINASWTCDSSSWFPLASCPPAVSPPTAPNNFSLTSLSNAPKTAAPGAVLVLMRFEIFCFQISKHLQQQQ